MAPDVIHKASLHLVSFPSDSSLRSSFLCVRVSRIYTLLLGATSLFVLTMLLSKALLAAISIPLLQVSAQSSSSSSSPSNTASSPFTLYTLTADNITATFIPYGARLTSVLVPDRSGNQQDVIAGYDDPNKYLTDTETNHTYFGPIVGRYANRIKNGTFTINGVTSHIPENENSGHDTLHGGSVGYDQRNWTVTASSDSSITFTLLDTGFEGFRGTVLTHATYTLSSTPSGPLGQSHPRLTAKSVSLALDEETPIMLANHIYWNLNAFTSKTILNDTTLWMPYSDRYIEIDNIEVPTGGLATVASKPVLDFTSPKLIGKDISSAVNVCGLGCTGYDNAFILDRPRYTGPEASNFPVLSLWSQNTGIRMDVSTNQGGLQIYSCNGQNGTIPVRQSQQQRNKGISGAAGYVEKYGCLVIETQDWIDGINYPEWGRNDYQLYSPQTGPAVNYATYDFSTF